MKRTSHRSDSYDETPSFGKRVRTSGPSSSVPTSTPSTAHWSMGTRALGEMPLANYRGLGLTPDETRRPEASVFEMMYRTHDGVFYHTIRILPGQAPSEVTCYTKEGGQLAIYRDTTVPSVDCLRA